MKRISKIGYCLLILTTIVMTQSFASCDVHASEASAQSLDIHIETVFNGNAKGNMTFPVKMTVHNAGSEMSGQLVIEIAGRDATGNIALAKAIHLPQNSTQDVWFALPGMGYSDQNNRVIFYKDEINDNNIIPFQQGQVAIHTSMIPDFAKQIGILSSSKHTFNFLNLMNENLIQFSLIHLDEESLPDEAYLLQTLDYIVINDFDTHRLSDRQVDAIKGWVEQGGQLILAGGSSFEKGAAAFSDLSPIQVERTISLEKLTDFERIAERVLHLSEPIEVSTGRVIEGQHLIVEQHIPIITKRTIQRGSVLYVAYDLSLDPLASWGGNVAVWNHVFSYNESTSKQAMQDLWHVNQALDYFSELAPPALGKLLLFFIGYMLLVAPVLYFVLKKRDKREWAWIVIPSIAVITSLGIFAFGAADRTQTLAQTLNIIELNEDGKGMRTSFTSVFVPKGGQYAIQLEEGMQAQVFRSSLHGHNALNGQYEQMLFVDNELHRIQFNKVPYWSTRKFLAIDREARQYGQLSYDLTVEGSRIRGEVTNLTDEHLEHLIYVYGDQYALIGELAPQATASFELLFQSSPRLTEYYYGAVTQPTLNYGEMTKHEEALLKGMLNVMYRPDLNDASYFVATSENLDETLTIANRAVPNKQTNLWRLQVELRIGEEVLADD